MLSEQEYQKYQVIVKGYEQKVKAVEDQRDIMQRKGQSLMQDFQERNN